MKFLLTLIVLVSTNTFYTTSAKVTKVENELITIEDEEGNLWECFGNAKEGEEIDLCIYTNGTSGIEDDIIVDFR